MLRLIASLFVAVLLIGCATHPSRSPFGELPTLRLSPASLGHALELQQRLQVTVHDKTQTLDALLEVDEKELRLGVQALGQSALNLHWDGNTLQQQRADWLPPSLSGERVLFDLQLVYWPADAIRAALPKDWSLQESAAQRHLLHAGSEIVSVTYPADNHAVLNQLRDGYQLDITSTAADGAGQ
ncbi:MAG TPA: DUF3261 domain-containing protein [Luteimonas sp.]|nr:DUF3261 domain-containing protein [Luteimonas sp.]